LCVGSTNICPLPGVTHRDTTMLRPPLPLLSVSTPHAPHAPHALHAVSTRHHQPLTRRFPRLASLFAVAALLLLTACRGGGDPYLEEYVTSRPAEAGLIGVYILKWQTATKDDPPEVALDRARIMLNADGTFTADNLPIFRPINDGFAFDKLVNVQGTWQLETRGAVADGDTFREIWGMRLTGPPEYDFAYLTGSAESHGLLIHTGAPASGAAVYFVRP
jgi:hypothetical protein